MKISISKSKTTKDKQGNYLKTIYVLEDEVVPERLEVTRTELEAKIDSWLSGKPKPITPVQTSKPSTTKTKKCEYQDCDKLIDSKYKFCYPHLMKIQGRNP